MPKIPTRMIDVNGNELKVFPADLIAVVAGVNIGSVVKVIHAMRAIHESMPVTVNALVNMDIPPHEPMEGRRSIDTLEAAERVAQHSQKYAESVQLSDRLAVYKNSPLRRHN